MENIKTLIFIYFSFFLFFEVFAGKGDEPISQRELARMRREKNQMEMERHRERIQAKNKEKEAKEKLAKQREEIQRGKKQRELAGMASKYMEQGIGHVENKLALNLCQHLEDPIVEALATKPCGGGHMIYWDKNAKATLKLAEIKAGILTKNRTIFKQRIATKIRETLQSKNYWYCCVYDERKCENSATKNLHSAIQSCGDPKKKFIEKFGKCCEISKKDFDFQIIEEKGNLPEPRIEKNIRTEKSFGQEKMAKKTKSGKEGKKNLEENDENEVDEENEDGNDNANMTQGEGENEGNFLSKTAKKFASEANRLATNIGERFLSFMPGYGGRKEKKNEGEESQNPVEMMDDEEEELDGGLLRRNYQQPRDYADEDGEEEEEPNYF